MYGREWEGYRKKFLAINKLCYSCGKDAEVVDHLVPHKGDKRLFTKTDNHLPLCTSCHNTITNLFDRRYVSGNPITSKLTWLNYRRCMAGLSFRVKVLPSYP